MLIKTAPEYARYLHRQIQPIAEIAAPVGGYVYLGLIDPLFKLTKGIVARDFDNVTQAALLLGAAGMLTAYGDRATRDDNIVKLTHVSAAIDCMRNSYTLYQQRSSAPETAVHQSLIDAANFMRSAEKIYTLMKKDPTLKNQFSDFCSTYERVMYGEKTKGIMYDLLQTKTFQGSPSPFSNPGRITVTAERLIKEKEQFLPLMKAMGELDAYIALIKYKKTQGQIIPFIYTKLTKTEKAFVSGKNFVHPAIPNSKPNSLILGGEKPSITIITGPNGCGKSFAGKSDFLNLILSEVFGIAQAEEFEHSAIESIRFVANISDEIGTKSRYEAEVESIGELYEENLETAHNNQKGIYLVDEPLSATNERGGSVGLEEYIERIKKIQNNGSLPIIITHHDIKDIDDITHYQVKDGEGKFILVPGRSDYSNAEKLVTEELNRREKAFKEHCLFL